MPQYVFGDMPGDEFLDFSKSAFVFQKKTRSYLCLKNLPLVIHTVGTIARNNLVPAPGSLERASILVRPLLYKDFDKAAQLLEVHSNPRRGMYFKTYMQQSNPFTGDIRENGAFWVSMWLNDDIDKVSMFINRIINS